MKAWLIVVAIVVIASGASASRRGGVSPRANAMQAERALQHDADANGIEHWNISAPEGARPRFFDNFSRIAGVALSQDAGALPFGRSVALLVGVSTYKNWDPLPGVKTTINQLREYLLGDGGFDEVFQITDERATPALVRDFMRRRFLRLKRNDRLLFYFGGHGMDVSGMTSYILFADASRSDIDEHSIPTNDIREWSAILPVKNVLFLLDSCSAGYGFTPMGGASTDADVLNALGDSRSRWIVTAGTGKQETFDLTDPQPAVTVFGQALLTALTRPRAKGPYSSFLTLDQVFADLKLHEVAAANKIGVQLTPGKYPLQAAGDFLFLNPTFRGEMPLDLSARLKAVSAPSALPAPPVDDWRQISVIAGGQRKQASSYVLDFGILPADGAGEIALGIRNETAQNRTLTFRVEGGGLQAYFEGSGLSAVINSHAVSTLKVVAKSGGGEGNVDARLIATDGKRDVFEIRSPALQTKPPTVVVEKASGQKPSGARDTFSEKYELCLGPAPTGYTLVKDSESFWLTGDRSCNAWSTCEWRTKTDANICFAFSLQGHNESLFESGVRNSEGHLKATYALLRSTPQVRGLNSQ